MYLHIHPDHEINMTNLMFTLSLFYIYSLIFTIVPILTTKNTIESEPILIENIFVRCYSDRFVYSFILFSIW